MLPCARAATLCVYVGQDARRPASLRPGTQHLVLRPALYNLTATLPGILVLLTSLETLIIPSCCGAGGGGYFGSIQGLSAC
ncbi:hypothetical protein TGAM01_v200155 [Trichoderma gamsii]|uniref:Uncharacterized protein n=1 Tax=Trichoderma gamsii TaxID=398673 RepID=A0A2P5A2G6_9HYPO|nr:hypothetical protein TGAM01_v200155 [Trichoderma gamsii]PON30735.1 hypothetical protein TGAM01_v200155 [Trichoderma gamsii]